MSISKKYNSIKSAMPKTVSNEDSFGQDITGAKNPVTQRVIAQEGEAKAIDKKKVSVLSKVLSKVAKRKK